MQKDQCMSTADKVTDFSSRQACSDGRCTGAIGEDGFCKTCGQPYEEDPNWESSEKGKSHDVKCRTCGFIAFGKDPSIAINEKCLSCGNIMGDYPKNIPERDLSNLLIECHSCKHKYSKRASICPKCGSSQYAVCQVCLKEISSNSESCTECGDPDPFGNKNTSKVVQNYQVNQPINWDPAHLNRDLPEVRKGIVYILFSYEGRINRKKFWIGFLSLTIFTFIAAFIAELLLSGSWLIVNLICMVPSLMLYIKRFHDRNKSGWFSIIVFIPILNLWPFIECGFFKGTNGPNKYGRDPLQS